MARSRSRSATADPPVLEIPVKYGNVNLGDETGRLGCSASRGNLTVAKADRNLVGKRLKVKIMARAGGAQSDQPSIPQAEADEHIEAVADVKSIGVGVKNISFGLTFALESVDVETLAHFAKREGIVTVLEAEDIPEDEAEEGGEE
jgi:hypothetical protein